MNRSLRPLTGLALVVLAACQDMQPTAPAGSEAPSPQLSVQQAVDEVMPGRILVRLVDGAEPEAVALRNGVAFERRIAQGRVSIFRGATGSERALAARLGADAQVVYAEPDYLRRPTAVDPRMWSFYNDGSLRVSYTKGRNAGSAVSSLTPVADADVFFGGAPAGVSPGGTVKIASIDTGVEMGHPEFGGSDGATIIAGYDYYSDDADPSDTDDHGTHTTGTMVGRSVGVAGAVGAAGNVEVLVYRVCGGRGCPTSAIVEAIVAATAEGVVAMNLSLGGGSLSQSESDAIAAATAAGSLVIAAAGNGGTGTVSCPACDPNAISVAATDWMDEHAYYTNWGPGLDVSAPGGELYSNTTPEAGIRSSVRGGGYAYFQGTSMATPHVTGAAAVLAAVHGLTAANASRSETLRALLLCTAADLGASGYDQSFGNGRLDLAAALAAASNVSCAEGGGGGGGGGGGEPGDGDGSFSFEYTAGKLQRGINAVRLDGWSGYSGSTVDMEIDDLGRHEDVGVGHIYDTGEKGAATYSVRVCTNEPEPRCATRQVIF